MLEPKRETSLDPSGIAFINFLRTFRMGPRLRPSPAGVGSPTSTAPAALNILAPPAVRNYIYTSTVFFPRRFTNDAQDATCLFVSWHKLLLVVRA